MSRPFLLPIAVAACALLAVLPAQANDFPTTARVDYVLACSGGTLTRTSIAACGCRIDAFAARFTYADWSAIETALSLQAVPGRRAAAIRGVGWVKDLLERYRAAEADAEFECR